MRKKISLREERIEIFLYFRIILCFVESKGTFPLIIKVHPANANHSAKLSRKVGKAGRKAGRRCVCTNNS